MASGEVYGAICDFLLGSASQTAAWTDTPVALENENADQSGNPVPPNPLRTFVEVEIIGTLYSQESLGAGNARDNRWDEAGTLFLNVLAPAGTGTRDARRIVKRLADLFRGRADLLDGDLEFRDAVMGLGRNGEGPDGNWFLIPVSIDWRRQGSPLDDGD
jgi:hypothetical protein